MFNTAVKRLAENLTNHFTPARLEEIKQACVTIAGKDGAWCGKLVAKLPKAAGVTTMEAAAVAYAWNCFIL